TQLQVMATAEQILSTIVSSSYFRANEAVLKIPLPPAWVWVKAAIAKGWTCNEFVSDDIFTATFCLGLKMDNLDISSLAEIKGGILKHGTWRATSCQLLLANGRRNTCTSCLSLLNGTRKRLKRLAFRNRQLQNAHYRFQTKQQLIQRLRLQSLKLDVARRKVKRAKLSNKSLKKKIKQLEEKFDALDHSKVEMLIKDDVQLTDSKAKCLNKKSMRYDADWLLDCLILRLKSKAAPYMASWIQPFAVFASKNSTSGEDLYRLVLKALVLLEEHGAIVKSIVCDGAATNKKMWSLAGVYGHTDDHKAILNNVMLHPTNQEKIYVMGDAPHLIKCIRNHILNTTNVQMSGKLVSWTHVEELFATDSSTVGGLQACSRLTPVHIHPTNMQKMNVSLAAQVLSKSVADLFRYYRTQTEDPELALRFKDTEGTEELFRLINDVFDIMNGRCRKNAISRDDWEGKKDRLRELLTHIDESECYGWDFEDGFDCPPLYPAFASTLTLSTLRVTILSTIDLVDELLDFGFTYVLTGKFNQDCIERFFGIIRSC
ncbi:uncharacterized protein LOC123467367, partial [Daphnia magna]|uniref:uncharacterized protein LOC123467367 n=1 Tax=Daphnia magna TaxID=35525 RepID=UPI001E1BB390